MYVYVEIRVWFSSYKAVRYEIYNYNIHKNIIIHLINCDQRVQWKNGTRKNIIIILLLSSDVTRCQNRPCDVHRRV